MRWTLRNPGEKDDWKESERIEMSNIRKESNLDRQVQAAKDRYEKETKASGKKT